MQNREQVLKDLRISRAKLYDEVRAMQSEFDKKKILLVELDKTINIFSKKNIDITDHAIVRYLERCKGIDIEAIKKEILSDEDQKVLNDSAIANVKLTFPNYRLAIMGRVARTVLPKTIKSFIMGREKRVE